MENNNTENNTYFDASENTNQTNEVISEAEFNNIKKKAKNTGRLQGFLITFFAFLVLIVGFNICKYAVNYVLHGFSSSKEIVSKKTEDKLNSLWGMVDKYYLWDADTSAAVDGMYKGLLDSLGDPYSVYYTKDEMDSLIESASGEYSGIGAYVTQNPDTLDTYISNPMPGSPAEEAGLVPDDYIYEIDGEDVRGLDLNVVVSKIKGPEGSEVVLGIMREGQNELMNVTVKRRKIEVKMLESEMLEDNIGYIWLYEFEKIAIDQFNKAYDELEAQGMEGLIIDLRDNPGGDLDAVVKLADEFLPEGVIVYTKDKNGKGQTFNSDAEYKNIPLVVLINGNSASASEILSGSLKDYGVATFIGTKTFGKGIVQSLFSLPDGTGVKITESEYYLPNDECIHGVGIEPDIELQLDVDAFRNEHIDNQKNKAIEVIKEKMKK